MNKHKFKNRNPNQSAQQNHNQNKGQKRKFSKHRRVHADKHLNNEIRGILKEFRFVTNKIRSYVVHCTEEQLLWSVNQNSWNIKQIIGFINIKDSFILQLSKDVISNESVEFTRPDTENNMKQEEFNNRSIEFLMNNYNEQRKQIAGAFYNSNDEHWEKPFQVDSENMDLKTYIKMQIENDEKLLDMIFMNLQRHSPWFKEGMVPSEDVLKNASEKTSDEMTTEVNVSDQNDQESDDVHETEDINQVVDESEDSEQISDESE